MTDYRIVYDDPDKPDEPVAVVTPSPEWMGMAMAGLLPPVSVYWKLKDAEAKAIKAGTHASFRHDPATLAELRDAPRTGPLTEREAIEYLILKDVPRSVWGRTHNRPVLAIIHQTQIPRDRTFRNAWAFNAGAET